MSWSLRLKLVAVLVLVVVALALIFGIPKLLFGALAGVLVIADKVVGALGADAQVAEPGRSRRPGLGGSTTKGTGEDSKRTRPKNSGLR